MLSITNCATPLGSFTTSSTIASHRNHKQAISEWYLYCHYCFVYLSWGSNAIMAITGNAIQISNWRFSFEKSSYLLGADQWVWARIQHDQKLITSRNIVNCQSIALIAEQIGTKYRVLSIYLSLSPLSKPMDSKRNRKSWRKTSMGRTYDAIEDSMQRN